MKRCVAMYHGGFVRGIAPRDAPSAPFDIDVIHHVGVAVFVNYYCFHFQLVSLYC